VSYRLLEEVPDLSAGDRNSGNMMIQGDNLDSLKPLLPVYAGRSALEHPLRIESPKGQPGGVNPNHPF